MHLAGLPEKRGERFCFLYEKSTQAMNNALTFFQPLNRLTQANAVSKPAQMLIINPMEGTPVNRDGVLQ